MVRMQALADVPGVRQQIVEAPVKQDWKLTPQAWVSWWDGLAQRCSLTEPRGSLGRS